ncbi:hypothetical protein TM239_10300 [Bradyrhizobium sp. TM239]|nr:hypothetical protein TM239_10300 [Bradyrhizobium sp. TM239]
MCEGVAAGAAAAGWAKRSVPTTLPANADGWWAQRYALLPTLRELPVARISEATCGSICPGYRFAHPGYAVMPRLDRGIQYAAAFRFKHCGLWNTRLPAFAGNDTECGNAS